MRILSAIGLAIGCLLAAAGTAMLFSPGPGALTVAVGVSLVSAAFAGLTAASRQPPPDP